MATPAHGTTALGGSPDPAGERLRVEIERLRQEAGHQRQLAHRRAEWWNKAHILLGFPAALLAGTAGAAGLATPDARIPAALIALASAGFAAGAGFLRGDTRCRANKRARSAWAAVEDAATLALSRPHLSSDDLGTLLPLRQTALAAYDAGDPQPPGTPPALPPL
ncbi:hypothetical protein [Streptomyces sp. NPDC005805]|uniref:hypothetical protein n=1 Tax=Streptomyces sp. NPDC005805 TaxID=3157068 RepID=UPI00340B892D